MSSFKLACVVLAICIILEVISMILPPNRGIPPDMDEPFAFCVCYLFVYSVVLAIVNKEF